MVEPVAERAVGAAVTDAIARFARELRAAGLRVGLSEHLDALEALRVVGLADRERVRTALAATLVKRSVDLDRFELLFEMHFGAPAEPMDEDAASAGRVGRRTGTAAAPLTAAELDELVFEVLFNRDDARLPEMAALAVDRYGGITPGTHLAPSWFVLRTLRRLRLPLVLDRLVDAVRLPSSTPLELRIARDGFTESITRLQREVVVAVRRRFGRNEGVEGATQLALADEEAGGLDRIESLLGAVDPAAVSAAEVAELHRALGSLAQKLAARITRDRRDRGRGRVDFRLTTRASMGHGGVPAELRFRHRRPSLPEIAVLVDVSASVAPYARFFLELVAAMRASFRGVRAFMFVADVEEVTDLFAFGTTAAESAADVVQRAHDQWAGHVSDYGRGLSTFVERWGDFVSPRTTVVVLGDARANGLPVDGTVLGGIRDRARRVYWLDPEPYWEWNEGDSVVAAYAPFVDGVFECRTVRHVEAFIRALD